MNLTKPLADLMDPNMNGFTWALYSAQTRQLNRQIYDTLNGQVFLRLRIYHSISRQIHNELKSTTEI